MAKSKQKPTPPSVEERLTPPYLPWQTFIGFIDRLKNTALPTRIDSSVMTGMSGSGKSALRTGLRFLGLIEGNGLVTEKLRSLVSEYGSSGWKEALSYFLADVYGPFLGDLDIGIATMAQLTEKFRDASGIDGSVLRKAVRFYLSALDEAGGGYSPHLASRGALAATRRRPSKLAGKKRRSQGDHRTPDTSDQVAIAPGMRRLTLGIPGKRDGVIVVPDDLTEAEWKLLDQFVRGYIGLLVPKK